MLPQPAHSLAVAALLSYAASSACYIAHLRKPNRWFGWSATTLAAVGAVMNLLALYARSRAFHSVPYRDLLGSMALFGFFLTVLSLALEVWHEDRSLGAFLMPAALVFLIVAFLVPPGRSAPAPELRGPMFALHVTLNMLAYAAFAVACALSVLYLTVGRSLKNRFKNAFEGTAGRLPTLGFLERANRTSLEVGVLALSVGLIFGLLWGAHVWHGDHPYWLLDPKVIAAFLTLGFYLFVVIRAHRGEAPVTTARLSVAGFVLVILSYTAINLFVSRIHVFT
jgi:ABC-type transport system involved in cytochrome c biogenesis permease subunit